MRLFTRETTPAWVVLQLVEECNLRCSMCYEWGEAGAYHDKQQLASLDLAVALRIVDACAPTRAYFELFGGEPLLYAGIWDVIRRIRSNGCKLAFPTNGTLVHEHAERLVAEPPNRIWISLDGPPAINDAQRGNGVFKRAMRGLAELVEEKRKRQSALPEIGITCVVTPANHEKIAELFLDAIDLTHVQHVSIELQSYLTEAQHREYAQLLREQFGVSAASYARAYVRDPALFRLIDRDVVVDQLQRVRDACRARGIAFFSQPKTVTRDNLDSYLAGRWSELSDRRARCAVPWTYAEISARGDVTTCHTFYDAPIGNVYEQSLLEIWRGERAEQLRAYLRGGLLPICTACCRYYQ